eukprot:CAMPEP_0113996886 /NCGR_PEP_ID=MMETSP0328-20130328/11995_1 /TAXON_ID=39455 /ORGANISM="Alexandrium minutum" /LENGTH=39 /assembly_acc=CAM_ASM_000350
MGVCCEGLHRHARCRGAARPGASSLASLALLAALWPPYR